ncbi:MULTISPECIES: hypothetical protein [unclassified Rhodococcus (in: high G+C Gram-positive bacteria)]|uniref:hypothetical protein n=1 Tax=unclassified Rhodococcus (in: high G+C Gram-positive bacteria) TaxID=192944 RepID=UPI0024B827DA|nr:MULTISPECIES: hypothetical protein [unclassified Rhodococcus (in: high G+C Gram-positive bacteria)]MDI9960693.1 hypothetical protein [Rhodococcus sp. IEGM 1237]MDI9966679.1 hypothetical protein [Rhodococcus sp. IEGM 1251]MDV8129143.1 hypothetical protein [Rhodococcus sp. IEGM 1304]
MNAQAKTAIDKLKIIGEITQNQELKQTIKVMVELVGAQSAGGEELGFSSRSTES